MSRKWVRNIKTGTNAIVRAYHVRRSDGKAVIEVDTGRGIRYWLAAHCVED